MRLADEKVVLLDYLESISNMPVFYPCAVSHVSTISLANFYVSMPFKKGNPLVDVFSRQLNNDLQQGKISKILGRYYVTSDIAQRVRVQSFYLDQVLTFQSPSRSSAKTGKTGLDSRIHSFLLESW